MSKYEKQKRICSKNEGVVTRMDMSANEIWHADLLGHRRTAVGCHEM